MHTSGLAWSLASGVVVRKLAVILFDPNHTPILHNLAAWHKHQPGIIRSCGCDMCPCIAGPVDAKVFELPELCDGYRSMRVLQPQAGSSSGRMAAMLPGAHAARKGECMLRLPLCMQVHAQRCCPVIFKLQGGHGSPTLLEPACCVVASHTTTDITLVHGIQRFFTRVFSSSCHCALSSFDNLCYLLLLTATFCHR